VIPLLINGQWTMDSGQCAHPILCVLARIKSRPLRDSMRSLVILASLLLFSLPIVGTSPAALAQHPQTVAPPPSIVSWEPAQLTNGSPCLFRVNPPTPLESLTGTWLGHKVFFNFDLASKTWYGVAGVSLETAPGNHRLELEGKTPSGQRASFSQSVPVGKAAYRTVALSVPRKYTEPDAETLARIKREQALKSEVFGHVSLEREWSGRFLVPVQTSTTEVFGTQRTFNGVRQTVHQGLDYRAATGTPVAAMNSGMVILARELFFEGNCVVIDHGQGLLTLYLHFSEIRVKEGERVTRGQVIGLSGATGRVTGPHLHVAVRWQGTYVNPATLLTLALP